MQKNVFGLMAGCLLFSIHLGAAQIQGTVIDPSGLAISGARVALTGRAGVVVETTTNTAGRFELPQAAAATGQLIVMAPGFHTVERPVAELSSGEPLSIRMEIAPVVDTVPVVGSAVDVAASEQGSSVGLVTRQDLRDSNQPQAMDLLRYIPGLVLNQTGFTGGVTGLYLRGGYPTFNLVEIDGVPVNAFGGNFDFSHIPAEALDRVEIARGPQSAVYGPYANSGAVNFVTRDPAAAANLDVVAEGGSYQEHRFGIGGGGQLAGFGIAASAWRMDDNGPVANSDYHNQGLLLNLMRRFGRQTLTLGGNFDSNTVGEPGPWGSDPAHTFTGIDTISRSKNNTSDYLLHYEIDFSGRVHQDIYGTFFLNNNGYSSPYGFGYNKDLRVTGESRTVVALTKWYTAAFGVSEGLEEVKNTYITDASYDTFPIRRNDTAIYLENRFQWGGRLFINAGVRGEFFRTGAIPTDGYSRPYFPTQTLGTADPKIAIAYARGGTRLHASFGTGLRPPGGFDLAYTDNPALKPERTRSFDAGVEQRFGRMVSVDATYFYNRYYDLIVILGGSLARLSHYQSDNIANSRAQGVELSARVRPARWLFVTAWYTRLNSEILSLNGSGGVAPAPFQVGQQLLRRPPDSGAVSAAFTRGRISGNVTGYYRGADLDVEPSFGATAGLFQDAGYFNLGINLNYALGRGFTAYGNLRNALNQYYEETFGYPSPRLNFVAGVKWSWAGAK
jgi:outer membrane receptor protein involved in Fe transport